MRPSRVADAPRAPLARDPTSRTPSTRSRAPSRRASTSTASSSSDTVSTSSSSSSRRILGFGSAGVDFIARLDGDAFPEPDGKYRAGALDVVGGGNVANGLTAASRLGASCALASKLGVDANARAVTDELIEDGVSCAHVVYGGARTPFTYIMVTKTKDGEHSRTCIHTPGEALRREEMTPEIARRALDDVRPHVVYFDGRLTEGAIVLAREAKKRRGTRVLVEAERLRENLDELVALADAVVTSKTYPSARFPECSSLGDAMMRVLESAPDARSVTTTLGARGAVALARVDEDAAAAAKTREATSIDDVIARVEALANETSSTTSEDAPGPSRETEAVRVRDSSGALEMTVEVIFAPARRLRDEDIVDTTGAGDAFIGTLAAAMCSEEFNLGDAMRLGAYVAAAKCGDVGARRALPRAETIPKTLAGPILDASSKPPSSTRRAALFSAAVVAGASALSLGIARPASANASADAKRLAETFNAAMSAPTFEESDALWGEALKLSPPNSPAMSAALSNRGTLRLQYREWASALVDLQASVDMDGDSPDPLALNNLGNAKGALGRWDEAMADFLESSRGSEDMREIALANYALAAFQSGREDVAVATCRKLLRRDPEFLDMRAALAAILWALGDETSAEAEWTFLCKSGRGFGAKRSAEEKRDAGALAYGFELFAQSANQIAAELDGGVKDAGLDTPCRLYSTTDTVANRWPPRATAALDAFLRVRRSGEAVDYDGDVKTFDFHSSPPIDA